MVLNLRDLRNLGVLALLFLAGNGLLLAQAPDGSGPTPSGNPDNGGRGGRGGPGGGGFGGPGGGGRGGFGGMRGGGGPTSELRNESTLTELQLSDEQKQKLQEQSDARRANRGGSPRMQELFGQMQNASDEERQLLQAEIQIEMTKAQAEQEEQVKQVIGDEKFTRLRQLNFHRQGAGAVTQDAVAKEMGLTQEQKDQIAKLQEEQGAAMRELGFRASPEDQQKITDKYSAKITAVLTADQQTKWQGLIGPPPQVSAVAGPAGAPPGVSPGTSSPAPRRPSMIVEVPPGVTPEVSFGADAKATQKLKFGFRYAPWNDVLKLFAESANLSLDLNSVPPGTFSYFDKKEYTPTAALDIINGYLLPKGFVLVKRDEFLVCISIDEEIPPNLVPVISSDELLTHGKNELLTVVFPLEGVDVEQIAKEMEQVKGPQGKVVGMKTTNSLLVTDIGTNLRRIQTLLVGATRGGPNDLVFKPYTMKYLNASDAELVLRGLLGLQVTVTNVSAGGGFDGRGRDPRFGGGGGPQPPTTPTSARTGKSTASMTSDPRTNALLVTATAADHTLIETALKTIDVEAEGATASAASNKPYLRVYKVTSAEPREVSKTIDALMPGIVVNEDSSIRSISIFANEKQQTEVETLIRQLDGGGGTSQVTVIPLNKMDASLAVSTLQSMFLRDGTAAPTIQADLLGRQVMVRGTADQLLQVKTLLTQLGEDGTGRPKGSEAGLFRRYPISGRDPEELLPLIERMWGTASPNPVRIVTPAQRNQSGGSSGPVKGIVRPGKGVIETQRPTAPTQPSASKQGSQKPVAGKPRGTLVRMAVLQGAETPAEAAVPVEARDEDALLEQFLRENGATARPAPAPAPVAIESMPAEATPSVTAPAAQPATSASASDKPPVVITVLDDELLLTSDDPAALDQMEELLGQTMEILPPRVQWTVYPLQTADATEIATMLEQLLPDASVSTTSSSGSSMLGSMGGGVSSFGSSLMGMTGLGNMGAGPQTLQIIPEVRLNALFVAGPTAKVREVEEMLKVLDASEWPDSLRSKTSRMVQLEYADAQEVLDVLKETYKGYLEEGGNNPQANALAMLMGGGRGGNQNQNQKPKAQLSLSADKRTNQIVVWSDDTIYQEVKTLTESLDESAHAAKRTVRVLSLQNTNSSVITSALGQLMPKVKVSSSGPRSSSSSSSSSSGSGNPPPNTSSSGGGGDNAPSQDQMRDFFRQQRGSGGSPFGQPGGGGSPFGSGGSGSPFGSGGGSPFGSGRSGRGGR